MTPGQEAVFGRFALVTRAMRRTAMVSLIVAAALAPGTWTHADEITDAPSAGAAFPPDLMVMRGDVAVQLTLTGVDIRRKFFVDVYWIAHYMENPPAGDQASVIKSLMTNDTTKQFTMRFARNVKATRIQRALGKGLQNNATENERAQIASVLASFERAIERDVKKDDEFVLRWLPGGRVVVAYDEEVVFDVTSAVFARILWSIWFGERSVVEPRLLVKRLTDDP